MTEYGAGKFVSRCDKGQSFFGSTDTTFKYCPADHELTGSKDNGFACCLKGQVWDGKKCKKPEPVCENGKVLVDGKCVCPEGQEEDANGVCKPKAKCSSGFESGLYPSVRLHGP